MNEPQASLDSGPALIRLTTAVGERALAARAESRLSALQLQVLRVAKSGASMSTLAQLLRAPKSTVTSAVKQLEAAGLATRTTDSDDHRRQIVRSTAPGDARLRDFDLAFAAQIDLLLIDLSPARTRRLSSLMAKLPAASGPLPIARLR